jgi:hypothetical protein
LSTTLSIVGSRFLIIDEKMKKYNWRTFFVHPTSFVEGLALRGKKKSNESHEGQAIVLHSQLT